MMFLLLMSVFTSHTIQAAPAASFYFSPRATAAFHHLSTAHTKPGTSNPGWSWTMATPISHRLGQSSDLSRSSVAPSGDDSGDRRNEEAVLSDDVQAALDQAQQAIAMADALLSTSPSKTGKLKKPRSSDATLRQQIQRVLTESSPALSLAATQEVIRETPPLDLTEDQSTSKPGASGAAPADDTKNPYFLSIQPKSTLRKLFFMQPAPSKGSKSVALKGTTELVPAPPNVPPFPAKMVTNDSDEGQQTENEEKTALKKQEIRSDVGADSVTLEERPDVFRVRLGSTQPDLALQGPDIMVDVSEGTRWQRVWSKFRRRKNGVVPLEEHVPDSPIEVRVKTPMERIVSVVFNEAESIPEEGVRAAGDEPNRDLRDEESLGSSWNPSFLGSLSSTWWRAPGRAGSTNVAVLDAPSMQTSSTSAKVNLGTMKVVDEKSRLRSPEKVGMKGTHSLAVSLSPATVVTNGRSLSRNLVVGGYSDRQSSKRNQYTEGSSKTLIVGGYSDLQRKVNRTGGTVVVSVPPTSATTAVTVPVTAGQPEQQCIVPVTSLLTKRSEDAAGLGSAFSRLSTVLQPFLSGAHFGAAVSPGDRAMISYRVERKKKRQENVAVNASHVSTRPVAMAKAPDVDAQKSGVISLEDLEDGLENTLLDKLIERKMRLNEQKARVQGLWSEEQGILMRSSNSSLPSTRIDEGLSTAVAPPVVDDLMGDFFALSDGTKTFYEIFQTSRAFGKLRLFIQRENRRVDDFLGGLNQAATVVEGAQETAYAFARSLNAALDAVLIWLRVREAPPSPVSGTEIPSPGAGKPRAKSLVQTEWTKENLGPRLLALCSKALLWTGREVFQALYQGTSSMLLSRGPAKNGPSSRSELKNSHDETSKRDPSSEEKMEDVSPAAIEGNQEVALVEASPLELTSTYGDGTDR
jgi:hypothetical protein